MAERTTESLEREARIFSAYLIDGIPSPYVMVTYARAHRHLALDADRPFDRVLIVFARAHPLLTRVADSYARLFVRRCALRRKLAVLMAILEIAPPADAAFAPLVATPARVVASLFVSGLAFLLASIVGTLALGPVHVLLVVSRGRA